MRYSRKKYLILTVKIAHMAAEHGFLARYSASYENFDARKTLLKQDDNGNTPLHIAAQRNHFGTKIVMKQNLNVYTSTIVRTKPFTISLSA